MKLELKHLSCYLPYGIKIKTRGESLLWDVVGIKKDKSFPLEPTLLCVRSDYKNIINIWSRNSKLILRPLSDLVSPKFASLGNEMNGVYSRQKVIDIINGVQDISVVSFYYIQLLLQNHFDIFGLIKNNLAIDINTLNQE